MGRMRASGNGGGIDEGEKSPSTVYYPENKYKQKTNIIMAH